MLVLCNCKPWPGNDLGILRRSFCLREGNDDLGMIHININQPQMRSRPSQMKSLEDTLKAIGTGDVKMQVRVSIILAHAFKRDGNHRPYPSATGRSTQLNRFRETKRESNLFAQYLKRRLAKAFRRTGAGSSETKRWVVSSASAITTPASCLDAGLSEMELQITLGLTTAYDPSKTLPKGEDKHCG